MKFERTGENAFVATMEQRDASEEEISYNMRIHEMSGAALMHIKFVDFPETAEPIDRSTQN